MHVHLVVDLKVYIGVLVRVVEKRMMIILRHSVHLLNLTLLVDLVAQVCDDQILIQRINCYNTSCSPFTYHYTDCGSCALWG